VSQVRRTSIPEGELFPGGLQKVDYADAYVGLLPSGSNVTPEELARKLMRIRPWWVRFLLALRDLVVRPFGLKHGGAPRPAPTNEQAIKGDKLSFFTVVSRTDRELMLAADDKHLESRLWILLNGDEVTVTTLVHYLNSLGVGYFFLVKPFHKLMLRSLLSAALKGRRVS
jgi:hypothetical protein